MTKAAVVRGISRSFVDALCSISPSIGLNVETAIEQHADYEKALEQYLTLHRVDPSDKYPDCCFVEDTSVVFEGTAVVNVLGASSRQGEEEAVRGVYHSIGLKVVEMRDYPEARLDGGDVLCVPGHIFVGLSKRTNEQGLKVLQEAFPTAKVHSISVPAGLHLKSSLSAVQTRNGPGAPLVVDLLVHDSEAGRGMWKQIELTAPGLFSSAVFVPDQLMANVVQFFAEDGAKNVLLMQPGFSESEKLILGLLAARQPSNPVVVHRVCMSELAKADGALTCCSVLI